MRNPDRWFEVKRPSLAASSAKKDAATFLRSVRFREDTVSEEFGFGKIWR
jgi:hypothetical protein